MSNNKRFGEVRETALAMWQKETKRSCELLSADLEGFELSWQNEAQKLTHKHVSFFSTLHSWTKNIDDILTDTRYDDFLLETDNLLDYVQTEALFRYYTRLLLVISEVLEDFVGVYRNIIRDGLITNDDAGAYYSIDTKNFSEYINTICKHKVGNRKGDNIHYCNHHIDHSFADAYSEEAHRKMIDEVASDESVNLLMINNLNFKANAPSNYVVMPKLSYCLNIVVNCYEKLDELFSSNPNTFKKVCDKYAQKS